MIKRKGECDEGCLKNELDKQYPVKNPQDYEAAPNMIRLAHFDMS